MCEKCTADIKARLAEQKQFKANNRGIVTVTKVDGDEIFLDKPANKPALHASHVGALLHWLRDDHFICGISSGTTAIKTMVGGGKLAECKRCANHASQAWAILNGMPDVRQDGTSGLGPDASGR